MAQTTFYDAIASGYIELHKEEQEKKIRLIKSLVRFKDNNLMLDLGCGPCFFFVDNLTVVGVDPSVRLLRQSVTKTTRIAAVGEALPFKDQVFDYVVSITALQNVADVVLVMKEVKRVVKHEKRNMVFTFLKRSAKSKMLLSHIRQYFKVEEIIEEEKDIIVITSS